MGRMWTGTLIGNRSQPCLTVDLYYHQRMPSMLGISHLNATVSKLVGFSRRQMAWPRRSGLTSWSHGFSQCQWRSSCIAARSSSSVTPRYSLHLVRWSRSTSLFLVSFFAV